MSGAASFRGMIEEALLNTHTAFVGKVVQVNGDVADIQPLNMLVTMEGVKKKLPKLDKVPILKSARKFEKKVRRVFFQRRAFSCPYCDTMGTDKTRAR